jgi:coenzyme F420-0:L-glutamate ligase/coenzyme F420-1:gamma-L-glutamate ligase
MASEMRIIGLRGLPDITPGLDLATAITEAVKTQGLTLGSDDGIDDGIDDILVVTQKVISKSEGRLVDLRTVTPSPFAEQFALKYDKDPRVVEVVLRESRRIVKMDQGTIISETHHGFVCANAGVDESNLKDEGTVALLPEDSDLSARKLRSAIGTLTGYEPAIIISDTFGRPWRDGLVDVAIGVAGMEALRDYRDLADTEGRIMKVTAVAIADELASAAELVMGKLDKVPVALVRGYSYTKGEGGIGQLIRPPEKDLFR